MAYVELYTSLRDCQETMCIHIKTAEIYTYIYIYIHTESVYIHIYIHRESSYGAVYYKVDLGPGKSSSDLRLIVSLFRLKGPVDRRHSRICHLGGLST